MDTKLVTYPWDTLPDLNEQAKEFISLGQWSLHKTQDRFLLYISGGCPCCHGGRHAKCYVLSDTGKYLSESTVEDFRTSHALEIIKFQIPERISQHYLKVKF